MSNKNKALVVIIIGAIIGGSMSAVSKIGFVNIPPYEFTFFRFLIASLCILPLFLKAKVKINKSFLSLLLLSILPVLNIGFFVTGLTTTTASISQMLYAGTPILTVILTYLILKEKLNLKKTIFVLLGLFGVLLVIFLPIIEKGSIYAGDLKGNLLVLTAVISYAFYVVLSKQFQKKYSPIVITSVFLFLSTFIFFFLSIFEFNNNNFWYAQLNLSATLSILYVSILGTVIAYLLGQYAIKYGGPILSSLGFYLQPIFGFLAAYILLGEQLTIGLIIGTIITLISIALITYF